MHDTSATGNEFFRCDFCRAAWSDSRPMVEGHQGSLICAPCLTVAYGAIVVADLGEPLPDGAQCVLCLEKRPEPHWRSPAYPDALACRRCIRQAAAVLSKDPESGWRRPEPA